MKSTQSLQGNETFTADPSTQVDQFNAGRFIKDCRLDLPPDDVVEEIDFERFFRLNLKFGDLHVVAGQSAGGRDGQKDRAQLPQVPAPGSINVGALPIALYMPFSQQWKLDGYSQGRIVNSFTLAPGEEQTIETFTWDRFTSSLDSTSSTETDQSTESSGTRRDVSDVSDDLTKQSSLELTSSGKVGFTVGVVNVTLNSGLTAKAGVNDAEKSTRSSIVEATTHSTNSVRTSRTLKVSETHESGSEDRVTRKLKNPNSCHTLTIPFFEVLANYRVGTFVRTADIRLVVLITSSQLSQVVSFTRQTLRVHETSLRLALLDQTLVPGFDAARLLDSKDRACAILCEGCSCTDDSSLQTGTKEWDDVAQAVADIAAAVDTVRKRTVIFPASVFLAVPAPAGGGGLGQPIIDAAIDDIKAYLFSQALADGAPRLVTDLAGTGITSDPTTVTAAQVTAVNSILGAIPADGIAKLSSDAGLADRVGWEVYGAILAFHPEFFSAAVIFGALKGVAGGFTSYDDAGLVGKLAQFGPAYAAWVKEQADAQQAAANQQQLDRIADEERALRVLETYGLREVADANERLDALLDHMNDPRNVDHYRFAVWNERAGAVDDQVMTLALAGIIDPTPVGIIGDQLALPLRLDNEPKWAEFFANSIADLVKNTIVDERRYILPTAALYANAIVGSCSACEHNVMINQKLSTEQAHLENELLDLEKKRLSARLAAQPPLLNKEFPPAGCGCCNCKPSSDATSRSDTTSAPVADST